MADITGLQTKALEANLHLVGFDLERVTSLISENADTFDRDDLIGALQTPFTNAGGGYREEQAAVFVDAVLDTLEDPDFQPVEAD